MLSLLLHPIQYTSLIIVGKRIHFIKHIFTFMNNSIIPLEVILCHFSPSFHLSFSPSISVCKVATILKCLSVSKYHDDHLTWNTSSPLWLIFHTVHMYLYIFLVHLISVAFCIFSLISMIKVCAPCSLVTLVCTIASSYFFFISQLSELKHFLYLQKEIEIQTSFQYSAFIPIT